jgi:hypothetical protein
MKRGLTAFIWLWAALAHAPPVTLTWDPSPSPEVINYRIYWGTNSGSYAYVTNTGLVLTQTVVLPQPGRWFLAATAVASNGLESVFSNEVVWAPPAPPVLRAEPWLQLTPEFGRSTNQSDWETFSGAVTWVAATNPVECFTLRGVRIERVERVGDP